MERVVRVCLNFALPNGVFGFWFKNILKNKI
jgi:hypothetical protein